MNIYAVMHKAIRVMLGVLGALNILGGILILATGKAFPVPSGVTYILFGLLLAFLYDKELGKGGQDD